MPEINLNNPDDVAKLNGCVIAAVRMAPLPTGEPAIQIVLSHVTLEQRQVLTVFARNKLTITNFATMLQPEIGVNISPEVK